MPIWLITWVSCMIAAEYADEDSLAADDVPTAEESDTPRCEKEGDYLDVRPTIPDAPAGGIEIRAPAVEIPPYSQGFWCYWGTHEGPTVGVTQFEPYQADDYDHHNLLRAVTGVREADGVMDVCPPAGEIGHYGPMYWPTGVEPGPDTVNWLDLPDGVAMKLEQGQKWVLDMHYINPTGCTLLVQNGVNLGILAAEDVETWAAPVRLDAGSRFELPPNETTTLDFDCTWPTDVNVLSVGSHMHESGSRFHVDHIQNNGGVQTIYEIESWDPEYRNFPVMLNYPDGGISIQAGETFRTSCTWTNNTDRTVGFPEEMCGTFVSAYPLDEPLTCSLGEWFDSEYVPREVED